VAIFRDGRPEAFTKCSSVLARLFSFCTTFTKIAITPSSEVEMMHRSLGWNHDFKTLLVMYHLTHVSSRDGTDLDGKLMLLSLNCKSYVCNLSQLGQQSWCPSCNHKGSPNARNYHSFYILGLRVKKLSSTMQF
jgi:hypothetical protein